MQEILVNLTVMRMVKAASWAKEIKPVEMPCRGSVALVMPRGNYCVRDKPQLLAEPGVKRVESKMVG